jgi:tetratricopeptide (TPR) repeat protein
MLDLYARAGAVVTTADWEDVPVPMVKHRLLDTAVLGVYQAAQDAPDLGRYFEEHEVPRWRDAGELVAAVRRPEAERRRMAAAARERALREHTWTRRWSSLIAGVAIRGADERGPRSRLFDHLLLALASRAEAAGRIAAAEALWSEAAIRRPDDLAAHAGAGRCRRDLGDLAGAIAALRRALEVADVALAARDLHLAMPPAGGGTGLGRLALFPPAAEPTVLLVAALVETGDVDGALQVLDRAPPVVRRAVAATLQGELPDAIRARLSGV